MIVLPEGVARAPSLIGTLTMRAHRRSLLQRLCGGSAKWQSYFAQLVGHELQLFDDRSEDDPVERIALVDTAVARCHAAVHVVLHEQHVGFSMAAAQQPL